MYMFILPNKKGDDHIQYLSFDDENLQINFRKYNLIIVMSKKLQP